MFWPIVHYVMNAWKDTESSLECPKHEIPLQPCIRQYVSKLSYNSFKFFRMEVVFLLEIFLLEMQLVKKVKVRFKVQKSKQND